MKWLIVSACVVAIALGFLGFYPLGHFHDDGLRNLSVTIQSSSGNQIRAVSAEAFDNLASAEDMLKQLAPSEGIYSATQAPFGGQPLQVHVPVSQRVNQTLLGERRGPWVQYQKLVVVVSYEDDKAEGRLVEIPDLRHSQAVTVVFR
jgi:hypothetical protein